MLYIIYAKNSQAVQKGTAFKNLGEKSCEIKGSGHAMIVNYNLNAIYSLAVFALDFISFCILNTQKQP